MLLTKYLPYLGRIDRNKDAPLQWGALKRGPRRERNAQKMRFKKGYRKDHPFPPIFEKDHKG